MPNPHLKIKTLAELKASKYEVVSVKEEIRRNLIKALQKGESLFPEIVGYQHSVIPELQNALLSRHDFILLGLRGQAKSRILRSLPRLLDEFTPIIKGSEINDNPFAPISMFGRDAVNEHGDDVEIEWLHRDERYGEKLATPDVTIADLIGDIDPIKAASKRLHYAHEGVIHFGIIPRTNRGIFAINELPDLQPRIQVGLFNLMQEKDIQIRGFPIRLPIDVLMVYSANPEDYTNRGNIITPLKDRIGSQIITHYPRDVETGMQITAQEAWTARNSSKVVVPNLLREIIEETAIAARQSEFVDQKSGVSARMTISFMENIVSNAERRCHVTGDQQAVARMCDLFAALSAITGKIELVYEGEQEGVVNVAKGLLGKAIKKVFLGYFPDPLKAMKREKNPYAAIVRHFKGETAVEIADDLANAAYAERLHGIPGIAAIGAEYLPDLKKASADEVPVMLEFILEGLHQHSVLSKDELDKVHVYGDMLQRMFDNFREDEDDDESGGLWA